MRLRTPLCGAVGLRSHADGWGFALCVHWARRRRVRAERLGVVWGAAGVR
eukprot:SAG11_NODE_26741_length_341_cov_0.892562_1_plen_49_part_01